MSDSPTGRGEPAGGWPLSGRQTVAAVLALVSLVFILQNTDDVTVELFIIDVAAPLWLVLTVMFLIGAIVGVMLQRRRTSA